MVGLGHDANAFHIIIMLWSPNIYCIRYSFSSINFGRLNYLNLTISKVKLKIVSCPLIYQFLGCAGFSLSGSQVESGGLAQAHSSETLFNKINLTEVGILQQFMPLHHFCSTVNIFEC